MKSGVFGVKDVNETQSRALSRVSTPVPAGSEPRLHGQFLSSSTQRGVYGTSAALFCSTRLGSSEYELGAFRYSGQFLPGILSASDSRTSEQHWDAVDKAFANKYRGKFSERELTLSFKCCSILQGVSGFPELDASTVVKKLLESQRSDGGWNYVTDDTYAESPATQQTSIIVPSAMVAISLGDYYSTPRRMKSIGAPSGLTTIGDAEDGLLKCFDYLANITKGGNLSSANPLDCALSLLALSYTELVEENCGLTTDQRDRYEEARIRIKDILREWVAGRTRDNVGDYNHVHYTTKPLLPGSQLSTSTPGTGMGSSTGRYLFFPIDIVVACALLKDGIFRGPRKVAWARSYVRDVVGRVQSFEIDWRPSATTDLSVSDVAWVARCLQLAADQKVEFTPWHLFLRTYNIRRLSGWKRLFFATLLYGSNTFFSWQAEGVIVRDNIPVFFLLLLIYIASLMYVSYAKQD